MNAEEIQRRLTRKIEIMTEIKKHKTAILELEGALYQEVKKDCTCPQEVRMDHGTYPDDGHQWHATECAICGQWHHRLIRDEEDECDDETDEGDIL